MKNFTQRLMYTLQEGYKIFNGLKIGLSLSDILGNVADRNNEKIDKQIEKKLRHKTKSRPAEIAMCCKFHIPEKPLFGPAVRENIRGILLQLSMDAIDEPRAIMMTFHVDRSHAEQQLEWKRSIICVGTEDKSTWVLVQSTSILEADAIWTSKSLVQDVGEFITKQCEPGEYFWVWKLVPKGNVSIDLTKEPRPTGLKRQKINNEIYI